MTKGDVNMAGYILANNVLAFYGSRRSRGQYKRKKERGEYPAILKEQSDQ